jgi:bacteriocin-like protein
MAVTARHDLRAYSHYTSTNPNGARAMTRANNSRVTTPANNIDLELTEDELDHVIGGNSVKIKPAEFVTFRLSTFSGGSGSS